MGHEREVTGGFYYDVGPDGYRLSDNQAPRAKPSVIICRRLEDFDVPVPEDGMVTTCASCGEEVVFSPHSPVGPLRVCFQCAGIEPRPFASHDK